MPANIFPNKLGPKFHHLKLLRLQFDQILRFFLCVLASAADAAAVSPNGTKTLVANGLITLFINGNPVLSN